MRVCVCINNISFFQFCFACSIFTISHWHFDYNMCYTIIFAFLFSYKLSILMVNMIFLSLSRLSREKGGFYFPFITFANEKRAALKIFNFVFTFFCSFIFFYIFINLYLCYFLAAVVVVVFFLFFLGFVVFNVMRFIITTCTIFDDIAGTANDSLHFIPILSKIRTEIEVN